MVYELEFKIRTPIITQTNIHLDAVLSFFSPVAHNKDYHINKFTSPDSIKQLPLPIDAVKCGNEWIFCCSSADFKDAKAVCDNATKRRDGKDALYYHKCLTPRTGVDKDVMLKLYGVACSSVLFLVSSSNRSDLERYARRVKNIGSFGRLGYGEVSGYTLSETALDWESCIIANGKAIRNIPEKLLATTARSVDCCRSPYWLPGGKERCATVGDMAMLANDAHLSEYKR